MEYNQQAKSDAGKPRLTMVPRKIIWDIAEVREYGTKKYGCPENWKKVEIERYRDALFRHFMEISGKSVQCGRGKRSVASPAYGV